MIRYWFSKINNPDEKETSFLFNTFVFLFFIIYLLAIFLIDGHSEKDERNIYLIFFTVGPLSSILFNRMLSSIKCSNAVPLRSLILCYYGYLIFIFMIIVIGITNLRYRYILLYGFVHFSGTACIFVAYKYFPDIIESKKVFIENSNKLLSIFLPSALFLFLVFFNVSSRAYLKDTLANSNAFRVGILAGLIAAFLILILPRVINKIPKIENFQNNVLKSYFSLLICLLFPALLFDTNLYYGISHYNPYIGPANAVIGGHIPLIDIHSQYGLCYLVFTFLFKFIFTPSYSTAAGIVSFIDVLFYCTFLLIIRKISKQNIIIIALGVLTLFFYKMILPYNIVSTPSVAGFRFLPPLLLLLTIFYLPEKRLFNNSTLIAATICFLWSFESLLYGAVTYAAFIVFHERLPVGKFIKNIIFLICFCIGVYILLSLSLFVLSNGRFPDYSIYLNMILAHAETTGREAWTWSLLVDSNYLVWIIFFTTYALAIIYPFCDKPKRINDANYFQKYLFSVAILGTLEITYFLGRSIWAVLLCTIFPLFIIILATFGRILAQAYETGLSDKKKIPISYVSAGISMCFILPLMTGFVFERFSQPFTPSNSNSTLLRAMFDKKKRFADDVINVFHKKVDKEDANRWEVIFQQRDGSYVLQFKEARTMINKWIKEETKSFIFLPQTTALLFLSGKSHKFPISNNFNDQLSKKYMEKIVNTKVDIEEGDIFIISDNISSLATAEIPDKPVTIDKVYNLPSGHGIWWITDYLILHKLMQDWDLCIVDKGNGVIVCKAARKGSLSCVENMRFSLE